MTHGWRKHYIEKAKREKAKGRDSWLFAPSCFLPPSPSPLPPKQLAVLDLAA